MLLDRSMADTIQQSTECKTVDRVLVDENQRYILLIVNIHHKNTLLDKEIEQRGPSRLHKAFHPGQAAYL
jgi:hypothetical protein